MIKDKELRLKYIKERVFEIMQEPLLKVGFKLNKQLTARKKLEREFEIVLHFQFTDYYPVSYQMYFDGAIAQYKLLTPLKLLYEAMKRDINVEGINNYLWNIIFSMGDFIPEFHNLHKALRHFKTFEFDSILQFEESLGALKEILMKDVIPVVNILSDYNLMKQEIHNLVELFKDEYINVYSFLVFTFLYDRHNFESIYSQLCQTTSALKKDDHPISDFFDHLSYVKKYLYEEYGKNESLSA